MTRDIPLPELPIVLAPMAGGPSTPELTAAVSAAGGLGLLAAGYLAPEELSRRIAAVAAATDRDFGVNIFHPTPAPEAPPAAAAAAEWSAHRSRLAAAFPDAPLPAAPRADDDGYAAKLGIALDSPAHCRWVSFAFGHPAAEEIDRLHAAGKAVALGATTLAGVRAAVAAGADAVVVQGIGAGGHRATVAGVDDPGADDPATAPEPAGLVAAAAAAAGEVPVIAAGGVAGPADVARLRAAGAAAVQVGTLFLTAEEAGTKPAHAAALLRLADRPTTLTRAFSGRWARTIANEVTDRIPQAPALYPQLHHLTSPMRAAAAAAGDPERLNLWAGAGFAACRVAPAAEILAGLLPEADR